MAMTPGMERLREELDRLHEQVERVREAEREAAAEVADLERRAMQACELVKDASQHVAGHAIAKRSSLVERLGALVAEHREPAG